MTMQEYLMDSAEKHSKIFLKLGYAPAGQNGPYCCKDTPIRNTAHWLITYKYLWETNQKAEYLELVHRFADFLLKDEYRGNSGAIQCMIGDKMDPLNGLVGQAWAIEALVAAAKCLQSSQYIQRACEIFFSHQFESKTGLWKRVDLDGTLLGYDSVYNHQLWFAAAGAQLAGVKPDNEIENQIQIFLSMSSKNFMVHPSGLAYHYAKRAWDTDLAVYKNLIKKYVSDWYGKTSPWSAFDQKNYEKSYHMFVYFGFAILYCFYPAHPFFKSRKFQKGLHYCMNPLNFNILGEKKKYSYCYNSPAFEFPFIQEVFQQNKYLDIERYWKTQLDCTFDKETGSLDRDVIDANTLEARIYEYVQYMELKRKNK